MIPLYTIIACSLFAAMIVVVVLIVKIIIKR
jgi:hypothetical protein